jgi:hypothetical protein
MDRLDNLLGYARAHSAIADTRVWIADLERMTTEQRIQFQEHPDIVAIIEAAGE